MSDKLQEINHENVLTKMHTYLHVWDLVGIINENIKDEEECNALLDVLEGAGLVIEQLEKEKKKLSAVEHALADGPQPCPGGVTAEQYNAWLHSVLPFLEEGDINASSKDDTHSET